MTEGTEVREIAEHRFLEALRARGARDPREYYRERLRELKEIRPAAYREAVEYYETKLLPAIAAGENDPLEEWLEYGRLLAGLLKAGVTVQIDPTGRSTPYERPVPPDHLVLHLPHSSREPALLIGIPPTLSPAQRATCDLLVFRRVAGAADL